MAKKERKILIVDDEKELADALEFDFVAEGFKVYKAHSGNAALAVLRTEAIDLVLSDVRMPDGSGVFALDEMKKHNPKQPVVVLMSGFSDISTSEAYHRGAAASFTKPFDSEKLLETIKRCLLPDSEKWAEQPAQAEAACPLEIKFSSPESARETGALLIGTGGLFVAMERGFPGTFELVRLNVKFTSVPALSFGCLGVVRWVRQQRLGTDILPGIGIEFRWLNDESRAVVSQLIASQNPTSFIPDRKIA